MNKILLLVAMICFQSIFSQVSMSETKLLKEGNAYKFSKYKEVFSNQEAISTFKQGRTNKTIADVLAFTGGFGMGFSLVSIFTSPKERKMQDIFGTSHTYKVDNSARWTVFGVSAGLAVLSIPLYVSFSKNSKKAIAIENGETTAFQPYFKLESAGNGMALSYNF